MTPGSVSTRQIEGTRTEHGARRRTHRSLVSRVALPPEESCCRLENFDGFLELARRWPRTTCAIEGATGLGAPHTARLRNDGIDVIDVPPSSLPGYDFYPEGMAARATTLCRSVSPLRTSRSQGIAEIDSATTVLRAIVDRRDDLVKSRTQTVNRLHVVLTHLIPGVPAVP